MDKWVSMGEGGWITDHGPRGLRQNGVYIDCWLEFEKKYFFCGNRRNRRNAVISE
jgi:hypothetical protein